MEKLHRFFGTKSRQEILCLRQDDGCFGRDLRHHRGGPDDVFAPRWPEATRLPLATLGCCMCCACRIDMAGGELFFLQIVHQTRSHPFLIILETIELKHVNRICTHLKAAANLRDLIPIRPREWRKIWEPKPMKIFSIIGFLYRGPEMGWTRSRHSLWIPMASYGNGTHKLQFVGVKSSGAGPLTQHHRYIYIYIYI